MQAHSTGSLAEPQLGRPATTATILFFELYKRDGFFSDLEMMLCAGFLKSRGHLVRRVKWWLPRVCHFGDAPHPFKDHPDTVIPPAEAAQALQRLLEGPRPDVVVLNRYLITNFGSWLRQHLPGVTLALTEYNSDHAYPDVEYLLHGASPFHIESIACHQRSGGPGSAPLELRGGTDGFEGYWEHYHPLLEYDLVGERDERQDARAILLTEGGCPFRADVRKNPLFDGHDFSKHTDEDLRGCSFCYEAGDPHVIAGHKLLALTELQLTTLQGRSPLPAEYSFDGLRILAFMPEVAEIILRVRPAGTRFLFAPRVDTITQNRAGILRALEMLEGTDYRLVFHLIGFENFSQRELDLYNKGIDAQENLDAIHLLRGWERDYPRNFETTGYSSHGFLMFNPWTELEDLKINAEVIVRERFEDFRERPWLTKLRLVPQLPLYTMARRDGLLAGGYDSQALDTSRAHGYVQETPWRFRDARVERVYRWTHRLLGFKVAYEDQLVLKRSLLSQAELFREIVLLFEDGSLLTCSDDQVLEILKKRIAEEDLPSSGEHNASHAGAPRNTPVLTFVEWTPAVAPPQDEATAMCAGWLRRNGVLVQRLRRYVPEHWTARDLADNRKLVEHLRSFVRPDLLLTNAPPEAGLEPLLAEALPGVPVQYDALNQPESILRALHEAGKLPGPLTFTGYNDNDKPFLGYQEVGTMQSSTPRANQGVYRLSGGSDAATLAGQLRRMSEERGPSFSAVAAWSPIAGVLPALCANLHGQPGKGGTLLLEASITDLLDSGELLGEGLAALEGTPWKLGVEGIDWCSFHDATRALLGHEFSGTDAARALLVLRQAEGNYPENFAQPVSRRHRMTAFTPWTSIAELQDNVGAFSALGFGGFCSGEWLHRLNLRDYPEVYEQAKRDGLINAITNDGTSWQFQDLLAEQVYRWVDLLLLRPEGSMLEFKKRLELPDALVFRLVVDVLSRPKVTTLPGLSQQNLLAQRAAAYRKLVG